MSADVHRDLFASVATYAAPPVATAIDLLDSVFQQIVQPALEPHTTQVAIMWCRSGSQRQQRGPVSAATWNKVRAAGPLAWLMISGWREQNIETAESPSVAAATMHWASDTRRASVIECSVNTGLLGGSLNAATQQQIVAWSQRAWQQISGIVGLITVDFVSASVAGSMSPYERSVGLSYPWAALDFREKLRGYYWGNLLHRQHVELLGGVAQLERAPVALVEPLGADGYYLQLTDNINQLARPSLQQLKAFFTPLLPEGFPQTPAYYQALPDLLV